LNRKCFPLFAAILVAAFGTSNADAQTPANVIVALGNGQMICPGCAQRGGPFFYNPIYALVTDANGNPIVNYPVSWTVSSGVGSVNSSSSNTDSTGTATASPVSQAALYGFLNYYQPFVITATAGNVIATFIETNAQTDESGNQRIFVDFSAAPLGTELSGTTGSTGTPFTVRVYSDVGGTPIPNVSVRLFNYADGSSGPSPTTPSVYCTTGSGADPYSALTDSTGTATCTPVFGPKTGSGQVALLVGGVPAGEWSIPGTASGTLYNPGPVTYQPGAQFVLPAYQDSQAFSISVTPATVTSITAATGNGQSAIAGAALASPLVATVNGTSGPLAGQQVTWSVTPAGAAVFNTEATTSNSSGQVSTNVTFTAAAAGAVTIKVTSATNSSASATFTVTAVPPVTIASLTKVGGDGQTAIIDTAFATPLAVQLATSSGSAVAVPITFSVSGPATLSASSASTNASGVAQVTATAGSAPGAVTVTATVGSFSVTFSLTVVPQGPTVTASSFLNGADQQRGSISACGLATLAASGVAPAVAGTLVAPLVGPLPYQLGNTSISFTNSTGADPAPLISVSANAATFLVPCDLASGSVAVKVTASGSSTTVNVNLLPASPGIFQTEQSDGVSRAVIERPDGSFASPSNPARRGETVTAFATGLGALSPTVSTNSLPLPGSAGYTTGTPSNASGQIIVGVNNAGTLVEASQLSPTQPGVWMITFQVPQNAPQSNSVVFSVGVVPAGSSAPFYSAGSLIPVE
jgi:adhesin/invasin